MEIFAETERLVLREMLLSDADGMFELDSDKEVHKYLGNKPVTNKEQSVAIIKSVRQQYIDNGIGRWAVIEKSTNHFIGWAGLKLVKEPTNNHIDFYDLGYRLIRKYWGNGYATESAMASLTYAFDKLKLNELFATAHIENTGSNRILSKIGFRQVETFLYENEVINWFEYDTLAWKSNPSLV